MSNEPRSNDRIKLEKELDLGKDFPLPDFEDWKTAARESLKGAPFEKLATSTYEGIDLQPIYTRTDIEDLPFLDQKPGFSTYLRGSAPAGYWAQPWEICQEIPAAFAHSFNEALKYDLQRGQIGIDLSLDLAAQKGRDSDSAPAGEVGKSGTAISSLEDLDSALADIDVEKYPLHIRTGFSGLGMIMMLNAFLSRQGKNPDQVKGSIDTDPLGYLVTCGHLPVSIETAYDHMARATAWGSQRAPYLKTIGVSGLPYHQAGADAVRELAYVLATAAEYIAGLSERGLSVDDIAAHMRFTFGIGPFYFMEIAKLRAARMLWAKIIEAWGGNSDSQKITIHARTSSYNQTRYDPYVNMLRTTTEAFSAVAAGVDSLHTNPFDEVFGGGDEFSRRAARNIQVLLREECRLDRLMDPAGGSYFIEKLTHRVSQKAWEVFQQIEAGGGMFKALQEGLPQNEITALHEKRKQDLAEKKSLLVGTNFSENKSEKELETRFPDPEKMYRERQQYMQAYREGRSPKQQAEIAEKLIAVKNSLAANIAIDSPETAGIAAAGTDAFLAGATLGEISAALVPGKIEPVSVKPLECRRLAESYEELRDSQKG